MAPIDNGTVHKRAPCQHQAGWPWLLFQTCKKLQNAALTVTTTFERANHVDLKFNEQLVKKNYSNVPILLQTAKIFNESEPNLFRRTTKGGFHFERSLLSWLCSLKHE